MPRKSRLGCPQCRQRKIRCDETYPICKRCSSSGRRCDGPFKNRFVIVGPTGEQSDITTRQFQPSRALSTETTTPRESRTFQYFVERCAPTLGGNLDADFWSTLLPSISHSNRPIWWAMLAIADLHEHQSQIGWIITSRSTYVPTSAAKWYGRSLLGFREILSPTEGSIDYQMALLSCILLVNIEFQQNNPKNACHLIRCGMALLEQAQKDGETFANDVTRILVQMVARQRALIGLFGHPYHSDLATVRNDIPHSGSVRDVVLWAREQLYHRLDATVILTTDAAIAKDTQALPQRLDLLQARQLQLLNQLELWHTETMMAINACGQESLDSHLVSALQTIQVYYELAVVWVDTCLDGNETAIDRHKPRFERMLHMLKKLVHGPIATRKGFSFELGPVAPLYMLGWKCRFPALRRKALDLLQHAPAQEALFSNDLHRRALAKIIELEEEGIPSFPTADHEMMPPEHVRLRKVVIHYEDLAGDRFRPSLIFDQLSLDGNSRVAHQVFL